jgi:D-tagatose-1,6-bisphosphate aldolase subunit GatZ/KbaZ
MNHLDSVVVAQKDGKASGVTSICSAHPYVLESALLHALAHDTPVLIEATCNQVNQFGGYTGMTPPEFVGFVGEIAGRVDFPHNKLILGGDHLGPLVWASEPAGVAMEKAKQLVRDYALAGFSKIHLDCSVPCADESELPVELVARRAAELAREVELACSDAGLPLPRYVIGTEVPPAGGAKTEDQQLSITDPADAARTIELTCLAFTRLGLEAAWERVIALVVQPGVEFGDETIHEYDRTAAAGLARFIETVPGLVYEAHSTDYQTRAALRLLVEDHFAVLKVGPGLTFAFRQAVFALAEMEEIIVENETSHIREILGLRMQANPTYWQKHYGGSPRQQEISLFYSFSDRIRYYWADPEVKKAFARLLKNLENIQLPLSLISEYMPRQYEKIRDHKLNNHPKVLLLDRVGDVLNDYAFACGLNPNEDRRIR